MKVTLKVDMFLGDGQYLRRGTVVDKESIPAHLQKSKYLASGVVNMDLTSPVDVMEITDDLDEEEQQTSPMQELVLPEEPKKPLVRRLKPKR
jgi:hypothetical protein